MKWIKTNDCLPKPHIPIIFAEEWIIDNEEEFTYHIGEFSNNEFFNWNTEQSLSISKIVYWSYIKKLPK